jgi:hypothetical protein
MAPTKSELAGVAEHHIAWLLDVLK